VSQVAKCLKSPLNQEEWQAAWDLVLTAFPQAIARAGWVPATREEAEDAARRYEDSMRDALWKYERQTNKAIENYRRSTEKSIANYRAYVMRLYYEGAATAQAQKAIQKLSPKSEQGKKLLKHGKFPKRDDALARFDGYEVVEVHDDGDLTITSGDQTYVVTTEGEVFKEAQYTGGYAQSGFFADTSASISASIARISHYPHLEEAFRSAITRVNK
jgi:hypothetical protein